MSIGDHLYLKRPEQTKKNGINQSFSEEIKNGVKPFGNSAIWAAEHAEYYSQTFRNFITKVKAAIPNFINEGYPKELCMYLGIEFKLMRNLAYWLSKYDDFILALHKVVGWKGDLGLELALGEIRRFQLIHNRVPYTTDQGMQGIIFAIINENWKQQDIFSWRDILIRGFGEKQLKEWKLLERKKQLDDAITELQRYYEKTNILPNSNIEGFWRISDACNHGIWKDFGISSWNELLMSVFGRVNTDRRFVGQDGFEEAVNEVKGFYEKCGKRPTKRDCPGIVKAILDKRWECRGIGSWNDFLMNAFSEVNKTQGDYHSTSKLNEIQEKLYRFKTENGRMPTSKDKGMRAICEAVRRGIFANSHINTWNELLKVTFREFNREQGKYLGKKGLSRAEQELKELEIINGKIPTSGDKKAKNIWDAIHRGNWNEFGILTWEDMINVTFRKMNT